MRLKMVAPVEPQQVIEGARFETGGRLDRTERLIQRGAGIRSERTESVGDRGNRKAESEVLGQRRLAAEARVPLRQQGFLFGSGPERTVDQDQRAGRCCRGLGPGGDGPQPGRAGQSRAAP